jgi:hypothetical protein
VWRIALLAIVAGAAACNGETFACAGDGDCALAGEPGMCIAGNCAYPDEDCASGLRYPAGLGGGLAGQCVPGEGATDSDVGTSNGPSSSSSDSSSDATSSGTTEAIDPSTSGIETTTWSSSSTGAEMTSSTGVGSSSTAAAVECTDLACGDCMRCVDAEACAEPSAECSMLVGCYEIAACMETCVAAGDCAENCCEGAEAEVVMAAIALHACRVEVCGMVCRTIDAACM